MSLAEGREATTWFARGFPKIAARPGGHLTLLASSSRVRDRGWEICACGTLLHAQALCADPKIEGRGAFAQLGETTDKQGLVSLFVRVQLAAERVKERERAAEAVREPGVGASGGGAGWPLSGRQSLGGKCFLGACTVCLI